jgi:hypothetical protein
MGESKHTNNQQISCIVITMYWNDHLPPHFHAKYGEHEITVNIPDGEELLT